MSKRLCVATLVVVLTALVGAPVASADPLTTEQVQQAQTKLRALGFEVGPSDGIVGPLTARGMCAFGLLYGLPARLRVMDTAAYEKLMSTAKLRKPIHQHRRYLSISNRCQVLYDIRNHRINRIVPVSTGRAGTDSEGRPSFATKVGSWTIYRRVNGWVESNQYAGGFMFKPMYFYRGEAIHGVRDRSSVLPYFASHGCVRTFQSVQRYLWRTTKVGTRVYVTR